MNIQERDMLNVFLAPLTQAQVGAKDADAAAACIILEQFLRSLP